jgi:hypothetical protein
LIAGRHASAGKTSQADVECGSQVRVRGE